MTNRSERGAAARASTPTGSWLSAKGGSKASGARRAAKGPRPRGPRPGEQLALDLARRAKGRGGWRPGAGRKSTGRTKVEHGFRPGHARRHPVHITLRAFRLLPSLRRERVMKMVRGILKAPRIDGFRVVHFSIQHDHLHLIVEADDKPTLSSGVRSLVIRFAKRLNERILHRKKGRVWADRYHRRDLKTPREVRNALAYVFGNYKKHGIVWRRAHTFDVFSSAIWFDGWAPHLRGRLRPVPEDEPPVHAPTTWLLATGWWEKHGPLDPREAPGARSSGDADGTCQRHGPATATFKPGINARQ